MQRKVRLGTWLVIFGIATTLAVLLGSALWQSDLFDWGPESSLRSACRRWNLPVPERVEDLEVVYGTKGRDSADDFRMQLRLRIPPEEMPEWMKGASSAMWGMQWRTSDAEGREQALRYGCEVDESYLTPHPGLRKFGDATIFADAEEGKIEIVWIR